ncbi:Transcription factor [Knufia obscura]|uniref:Transcription factor n=2 Tax=Knufia TaxID=430999 RepID=A0AAN8FFQ9_9EURO|nr:Transcription factor [Knufia obscura]KAK5957686.1 Transcription factor [Knufia fluminis]
MPEPEHTSSPDSAGQSPGDPSSPGSSKRNGKTAKPRLTAHQKNTNHKDAENKRRTAIRDNFLRLSQIVPGTEGQERSEQVMLTKSKDFLVDGIDEIRRLKLEAESKGLQLSDLGDLNDTDYGGPKWRQPHLDKYYKNKSKKASKSGNVQDDADGEAEDE